MIISVKEAQEILKVSRQRISLLLKDKRIGNREEGIDLEKVILYKYSRKTGRPVGSYKKEKK